MLTFLLFLQEAMESNNFDVSFERWTYLKPRHSIWFKTPRTKLWFDDWEAWASFLKRLMKNLQTNNGVSLECGGVGYHWRTWVHASCEQSRKTREDGPGRLWTMWGIRGQLFQSESNSDKWEWAEQKVKVYPWATSMISSTGK